MCTNWHGITNEFIGRHAQLLLASFSFEYRFFANPRASGLRNWSSTQKFTELYPSQYVVVRVMLSVKVCSQVCFLEHQDRAASLRSSGFKPELILLPLYSPQWGLHVSIPDSKYRFPTSHTGLVTVLYRPVHWITLQKRYGIAVVISRKNRFLPGHYGFSHSCSVAGIGSPLLSQQVCENGFSTLGLIITCLICRPLYCSHSTSFKG
jgi:hypothetical protein